MTVLDLSQYDLPTLTTGNTKAMADYGVTGAILGVYSPTNAPEEMAAAAERLRDAGISILGFYGLIYFGHPYGETRDVDWAIQLAQRYGVSRVWLDCEIDAFEVGFVNSTAPNPEKRVAAVQRAVDRVQDAGLNAGIYTGSWWWSPKTWNSTAFSHLPLWHAAYPYDGQPIRTVNYGGWTDVAIHQYTSSLYVAGRNRDANYVFMEEEDMSALEDRVSLLERIIATNNSGPGYAFKVPVVEDNLPTLQRLGFTVSVGDEVPLAGDKALAYLDLMGNNLYLGLGQTQAQIASGLSEHTHDQPAKTGGVSK